MKKSALAVALSAFATSTYAQSTDEKLRILQQEIDELKAQVKNAPQGSAGQQATGSAGPQASATTAGSVISIKARFVEATMLEW